MPDIPRPEYIDESLTWPEVSYFGIFDGRNGTNCAKFVKENLHHYVLFDL